MADKLFLKSDIKKLRGVGEKRASLYLKMGITNVEQLLEHFPRGYADMSGAAPLSELAPDSFCAVKCTAQRKTPPVRSAGGRLISRVYAVDDNGDQLEIMYFNNRFAPAAIEVGEEYVFYGKLQRNFLKNSMINPVTVTPNEQEGLTPVYPLTEGLSSRMVAANVRQALVETDYFEEFLPKKLLSEEGLISRDEAIRHIHFPSSMDEAEDARKRLTFDELYTLSLGIRLGKNGEKRREGHAFSFTDTSEFEEKLPFALTDAQKRCIAEISADLGEAKAMNRLLQGDVGSGKTAVAAAAVYLAAANGFQSAVMAPTEVLAQQHAETFRKMLSPFGINVCLLTGNVKGKARNELLRHIEDGSAQLIVGTHALISGSVTYSCLGLVVADEQHRFGVAQRSSLAAKGENVHILVMSATPIPRTLSLIVYGDLDISVLDQLPGGRKPIKTVLVDDTYRDRYLGFVRKAVSEGHQAYIVCSLVDGDEDNELISVTEYYKELSDGPLKGIDTGLLHGRMAAADKAEVMKGFSEGRIKVLVSTTVIEVGVDCPNATVIIVENADRFGLSTLHQLRGRVGRGNVESWCVLVSDRREGLAGERLKLLCDTTDGFEIARFDLATRGPGDMIGNRQHGLPELKTAYLSTGEDIIIKAGKAAERTAAENPELTGLDLLRERVDAMFSEISQSLN